MLKLENQGSQGKLQTGGFARELEMEWKWHSWQGRLGTKAQWWEGSPKQDSNKTFVREGKLVAGRGLTRKAHTSHRGKASVSSCFLAPVSLWGY